MNDDRPSALADYVVPTPAPAAESDHFANVRRHLEAAIAARPSVVGGYGFGPPAGLATPGAADGATRALVRELQPVPDKAEAERQTRLEASGLHTVLLRSGDPTAVAAELAKVRPERPAVEFKSEYLARKLYGTKR